MHELSVALSVLDAVEEQSRLHGGARVTTVRLKVGPLSGVTPQLLRSAFELAQETSNFPDCLLEIEQTPVRAHCPNCGCDQPVTSIQEMTCAVCGALTADVASGRELEVAAVEIAQ